jgi:ribonuclease HI
MKDPKHVLYFDGACEPVNPGGHMVFAWVLKTIDGDTIAKDAAIELAAPMNTNNIAEWKALINGVRGFCARGLEWPLLIYGDSKLVICQLNGDYACHKEHLRRLRDECRAIIHGHAWFAGHIKREFNEEADSLGRAKYLEVVGREMPNRHKGAA